LTTATHGTIPDAIHRWISRIGRRAKGGTPIWGPRASTRLVNGLRLNRASDLLAAGVWSEAAAAGGRASVLPTRASAAEGCGIGGPGENG
jgi:hypothetical protein